MPGPSIFFKLENLLRRFKTGPWRFVAAGAAPLFGAEGPRNYALLSGASTSLQHRHTNLGGGGGLSTTPVASLPVQVVLSDARAPLRSSQAMQSILFERVRLLCLAMRGPATTRFFRGRGGGGGTSLPPALPHTNPGRGQGSIQQCKYNPSRQSLRAATGLPASGIYRRCPMPDARCPAVWPPAAGTQECGPGAAAGLGGPRAWARWAALSALGPAGG
jgi:hypothetical protein